VRVKFTQSARKHKIGRAHVLAALENADDGEIVPAPSGDKQTRRKWIAVDNRGVELEIMGVETLEYLLIIHVMPTALVRKGKS